MEGQRQNPATSNRSKETQHKTTPPRNRGSTAGAEQEVMEGGRSQRKAHKSENKPNSDQSFWIDTKPFLHAYEAPHRLVSPPPPVS